MNNRDEIKKTKAEIQKLNESQKLMFQMLKVGNKILTDKAFDLSQTMNIPEQEAVDVVVLFSKLEYYAAEEAREQTLKEQGTLSSDGKNNLRGYAR